MFSTSLKTQSQKKIESQKNKEVTQQSTELQNWYLPTKYSSVLYQGYTFGEWWDFNPLLGIQSV